MKTSTKTLIICVAFLALGAGPARASSYDFVDHNNNNYSDDGKSGKGDKDSDWSSGDKSDDGDNYKYKSGGYSSPGDNSSWSDGGSHNGDDHGGKYKYGDGNKDKDGKGDAPPPPQCAAADPGHDKWGGDGKGDKGGKKGSSGWGDDGGGDKWGHNYYKNICDKDPGKGRPGHHHCDPGDPAPLPASLPLFAAAVGFLTLRKKAHGRFAK